MSEEKEQPKRSASERIQDLETHAAYLSNVVDNMAKDLMLIKSTLELLDNKVEAFLKASIDGVKLTKEVVDKNMVESNVAKLANKVANMVVNGVVKAEEVVSDNSFVVGQEIDGKDEVVNPRIQFALKALTPELQSKILGTKPGDVLELQEGKLKFRVLESYQIQTPKEEAESASETQAEAQPENAEVNADDSLSQP